MLIHGDFDLSVQDWRHIDLTNAVVQMAGDRVEPRDSSRAAVQTFEAPAVDCGSRLITLPAASLYSIATLRIGPKPTTVRLVDRRVNTVVDRRYRAAKGPEAVYVQRLILDPGVTLDLAGLNLCYERVTPADPFPPECGARIVDSHGGGRLRQLESAPRDLTSGRVR